MLRTLFPALALIGLTSLASAQYDETRCRSVASPNYARANGDGTATGRLTDLIIIKNSEGRELVRATVEWFKKNLPYYVYSVDRHSTDQFSVRFAYWCLLENHPKLKGGSVEVWRGYDRVDLDPLL
jgi:hypothetical protein